MIWIDLIFTAVVGFFVGCCGGFFCVTYVPDRRKDIPHDPY